MFSFTEHQIFLHSHYGHDLAECTIMYYSTGTNISLLICLLCCNVDFSELSLHLNSTDVNRVLFYTTQKICNLSLFSELGSYLICLYTIGPQRIRIILWYTKNLYLCGLFPLFPLAHEVQKSVYRWQHNAEKAFLDLPEQFQAARKREQLSPSW